MTGDDAVSCAEPYAAEILIEPDGTVFIKHLDEPLLRLALELNPRDERLLARAAQLPEDAA